MKNFFISIERDYQMNLKQIMKMPKCSKLSLAYLESKNKYDQLKEFASNYTFKDQNEEIEYFKIFKPFFQSQTIYFNKLVYQQNNLPFGCIEIKKNYFKKFLLEMNSFYEENKDFINYYRSSSEKHDKQYFVREFAKNEQCYESINCDVDYSQSTGFDLKVAKLLAYSKLEKDTLIEIKKLENTDILKDIPNLFSDSDEISPLNWTDSKISLIELVYALESSGALNNGKIEIRTIVNQFEKMFNIELGDVYKAYIEIKGRKISNTKFLDRLKENLSRKIDNDDQYII